MLHSVGDVVALSVLPALNRHGKRGCTMDYVQLIVILSRYCRSIIVEVWYHKVEVSYRTKAFYFEGGLSSGRSIATIA